MFTKESQNKKRRSFCYSGECPPRSAMHLLQVIQALRTKSKVLENTIRHINLRELSSKCQELSSELFSACWVSSSLSVWFIFTKKITWDQTSQSWAALAHRAHHFQPKFVPNSHWSPSICIPREAPGMLDQEVWSKHCSGHRPLEHPQGRAEAQNHRTMEWFGRIL